MYPVYLGKPLIFFIQNTWVWSLKKGHLFRLKNRTREISERIFKSIYPLVFFTSSCTHSARNFSVNLHVFNQLRLKYKVGEMLRCHSNEYNVNRYNNNNLNESSILNSAICVLQRVLYRGTLWLLSVCLYDCDERPGCRFRGNSRKLWDIVCWWV